MATSEAGDSTFTAFHELVDGVYRVTFAVSSGEQILSLSMPKDQAIEFATVMVQTLMHDERSPA